MLCRLAKTAVHSRQHLTRCIHTSVPCLGSYPKWNPQPFYQSNRYEPTIESIKFNCIAPNKIRSVYCGKELEGCGTPTPSKAVVGEFEAVKYYTTLMNDEEVKTQSEAHVTAMLDAKEKWINEGPAKRAVAVQNFLELLYQRMDDWIAWIAIDKLQRPENNMPTLYDCSHEACDITVYLNYLYADTENICWRAMPKERRIVAYYTNSKPVVSVMSLVDMLLGGDAIIWTPNINRFGSFKFVHDVLLESQIPSDLVAFCVSKPEDFISLVEVDSVTNFRQDDNTLFELAKQKYPNQQFYTN